MIIWITGASKSGKTTFAKKLQSKLVQWVVLDGDEIRSITDDLGFSAEDRMENCKRIARLARNLDDQGFNVIVSVIAPFQKIRDQVSKICHPKWVCLPRPLEETAYDNPYEVPTHALFVEINEEDKIIEELKLFSVFVVGTRRSGTALMVQILEKLGVKMFYDLKGVKGYEPHEILTHAMTKFYKMAYTPYTGCKILLPFVPVKIDMITDVPCKVVFVWREPRAILDSTKRFWPKQFPENAPKEVLDKLLDKIDTEQASQLLQLRSLKVKVLVSKYEKMIADPKSEIQKIANFIRSEKPVDKAVKLVKIPITKTLV